MDKNVRFFSIVIYHPIKMSDFILCHKRFKLASPPEKIKYEMLVIKQHHYDVIKIMIINMSKNRRFVYVCQNSPLSCPILSR